MEEAAHYEWQDKRWKEITPNQMEQIRQWEAASMRCPMRKTPPTVQPFCRVGGWRRGGYDLCQFDTCFARFAALHFRCN
jgi:hypothetical protein